MDSPYHAFAKHRLLETYLLRTAPFRGMLLTPESVLKRLAPTTYLFPGRTDSTTDLSAIRAFQHRAFTAHTKVRKVAWADKYLSN